MLSFCSISAIQDTRWERTHLALFAFGFSTLFGVPHTFTSNWCWCGKRYFRHIVQPESNRHRTHFLMLALPANITGLSISMLSSFISHFSYPFFLCDKRRVPHSIYQQQNTVRNINHFIRWKKKRKEKQSSHRFKNNTKPSFSSVIKGQIDLPKATWL